MKLRFLPLAVLSLVIFFAPPAETVIPAGFSDVVILATNSVVLKKDVEVMSGDVAVNDASSDPDLHEGVELSVDKDVSVAGSLSANRVKLAKGAQVGGSVFTNDLTDKGATIGGGQFGVTLPVFAPLPLFFSAAAGADDIAVASNGSDTLAPGSYRDVSVGQGGVLLLAGGDYHLRSIQVEMGGQLRFGGASAVTVEGRINVDKDSFVVPDGPATAASEIVFYVAGTDDETAEEVEAVRFNQGGEISANFYVPNGTFRADNLTVATGAFLAKDVWFHIGSTITLDTFFFNKPPVAGADSAETLEDVSVTGNVLTNDTDPNADPLTATALVNQPTAIGSVSLQADGSFNYTPTPNLNGPDSFVYEVCDGGFPNLCDTATVTITVIPVNDAPVAIPGTATTDEDQAVTIPLSGGDVDVVTNSDDLTFSITSGPSNGTLSGPTDLSPGDPEGATVDYQPNLNFNGQDTFTFQVCDIAAACSASATVTITVTPVNDAPSADGQSGTTDEDTALALTLTGSDIDVATNGDSLTFSIMSGPFHGALSGVTDTPPTSATVQYTPDENYHGPDSFEFKACDLGGLCDTATVTISVLPVNDDPMADGQSVTTDQETDIQITLTGSDVDGDSLSFSITGAPTEGTLTPVVPQSATSATLFYSPDGDFVGVDSFDFEVDDGNGGTATATVTVVVQSVNTPPVANGQAVITSGITPLLLTLTGSDADGDTLSFSITVSPAAGTLSNLTQQPPTSATVLYTPVGAGNVSDSFTFEVCDNAAPQGCDSARVTINGDPESPNDPPVAVADSAIVEPGGTVTSLTTGATSVLANDFDPNGDNLFATTTPVAGPSHGSLALNVAGTFSYTHDGGASMSDQFTYEVCDNGSPVLCSSATVFITIRVQSVTVTVSKQGSGAGASTVVSSPAGLDCGSTCSSSFPTTGSIQLQALAGAGFVFDGWGGDVDCFDGALGAGEDATCTASFINAPPPPVGTFDVTVSRVGTGFGAVVSTPAGIDCGSACAASFPAFRRVDLKARAATGSEFVGWSGNVDCQDSILDGNGDKSCTAIFNVLPPPPPSNTLTVVTAGNGKGTVTSKPAGVVCGASCVVDFGIGAQVILFARPDNAASTFGGWSGDADCTDGIVTMDSDKTCTATFTSN